MRAMATRSLILRATNGHPPSAISWGALSPAPRPATQEMATLRYAQVPEREEGRPEPDRGLVQLAVPRQLAPTVADRRDRDPFSAADIRAGAGLRGGGGPRCGRAPGAR